MIIENTTNNVSTNPEDSVIPEPYEPRDVISPMFGFNHQIIVANKTKIDKTKNTSTTLEQYVEQKTKINIINEKVETYSNTTSLDSSRMNQIEKIKQQQAIYDALPSRYLEFREKITPKTNQTPNYCSTNDTIITTIDLLVDDILNEK